MIKHATSLSVKVVLTALLMVSTAPLARSFDPEKVNWAEVTSTLRWLNFCEGGELWTLTIDGFPAFKKVKRGGIFPSSPFPPGKHAADVVTDGKSVLAFPLSIEPKKHYSIVTFGKIGSDAQTIVIESSNWNAEGEGEDTKVTFHNFFGAGSVSWVGEASGKTAQVKRGERHEFNFPPEEGLRGEVQVARNNGEVFTHPLVIAVAEAPTVLFIFCYATADAPERPKLAVLDARTNILRPVPRPTATTTLK